MRAENAEGSLEEMRKDIRDMVDLEIGKKEEIFDKM